MRKNNFFVIFFIFIGSFTLSAQEIFSFIYAEWPDGCLTNSPRGHYDSNVVTNKKEHRNDTATVNILINNFWNYVRQYNAVEYRQGQHNAGDYVYNIVRGSIIGDREIATTYTYSIFRVRGESISGSSSYSPTYLNSFANSKFFVNSISFVGYNYSFGFPLGLTFGVFGFYTSLNFNLSAYFDGATSGSTPDGITGETTVNGFEFTIGYSFKLIDDLLRLPVGIGMRMTDEYHYYHDEHGEEGWYTYGSGSLEDKEFIAEAGLQLILIRFLYLSATYRLIGFSKSGFTIGAGFIF